MRFETTVQRPVEASGVGLHSGVPVRIRITNVPPEVVVSAGMTCTVVLKDGAHPQIGASAKQVLAAIRYWFTGETVASAQRGEGG